MHRTLLLSFIILFTAAFQPAPAQKNPVLAKSPPMGWNSWNWFGKKEINEQVVKEVIDAIADQGLKDAGYLYVVVDGGWRDVKLDPAGKLLAHPVKFPHGIKPLADYAHSKGLKFGLHVVPGTNDCGGDPVGGFNREEIHVRQFVEWGLDFIKVDLCKQTEDSCSACQKTSGGWSEPLIKDTYTKWSRLLKNCGRDILFSLSAYQFREWNPAICNMSRTTYDIQCRVNKEGALFDSPQRGNKNYLSVMAAAEINNDYYKYAGNGYWNDPDMMVTGNQGLTFTEQKSHFALWCIMSSPLILGNDPVHMSNDEKVLICNREMIAVNQDPTEQGHILKKGKDTQIWTKKLRDGATAVLFINLAVEGPREIKLAYSEIGINGKYQIRDMLNNKNVKANGKDIVQILEPHACSFFLISGRK